MRAFVTGSTGFAGTCLIQALDQADWEIIALCPTTGDLEALQKCKKVIFALGDILNIESLRRGMPPGVDAVFHWPGSVGPVLHGKDNSSYDFNQQGTRHVVEVALEKKIGRFIYTSPQLTQDTYLNSKRLADIEVERGVAAGLDAVFLHPSACSSADDKVTESGSPCHCRKLAQAHLAAFHKGLRGQHYFLEGPALGSSKQAYSSGQLLK